MRKVILISFFALLVMSMDKNLEAYKIFDSAGSDVTYKKFVVKSLEADIILFGELHNNPICHWIELELTKSLYSKVGKKLILGAEMFESDNSLIIREYLAGKVKDRNFEAEARLWPNYKTDYKPLLTFARDSGVNFIATNIPRRYAAMVNNLGLEELDNLDSSAKDFIAPLPIEYDPELTGYKNMLDMMGSNSHPNANLPKAQAIKDATMAYFIAKNYTPQSKFLHFHGTYHSDNFQGIMWYLRQINPNLKIVTISSVEQDKIKDLDSEHRGKADFIIAVPSSMTKTY